MPRSHLPDVDKWESDSDAVSDADFSLSPSKQAFTHLGNLNIRGLKPSRIGRETDQKKVSVLPSMTAVNSSSKRNLVAMTELDELNTTGDSAEPPRNVARLMLAIDSGVEVGPERFQQSTNQFSLQSALFRWLPALVTI